MNVISQCCGLVVVFIVLLFYKTKRRLRNASTHLYQVLVFSVAATILSDIVSVMLLDYADPEFDLLKITSCRVFLACVVASVYLAFRYMFYGALKRPNPFLYVFSVIFIIFEIIVMMLPVHCIYQETEMFYGGSAVTFSFAAAFTLSGVIFLAFLRYMKVIDRKRAFTVMTWTALLFVGGIIQCFNFQFPVISFFSAIGLLVAFLMYENPELNLDRRTGLFSHDAFDSYLTDYFHFYSRDKKMSVCLINFGEIRTRDIRLQEMEAEKIARRFCSIKSCNSFRIMQNRYAVCSYKLSGKELTNFLRNEISNVVSDRSLCSELKFVWIDDVRLAENKRRLMDLFAYAFDMNRDSHAFEYEITAELAEQQKNEKAMTAEIIQALVEDRVKVFYQPIYSVKDDRFVSAEALARIQLDDGSYIQPSQFIGIAEKNGLIAQLGVRVFEEVCRFFSECTPENYGIRYIEVNLSPAQCGTRQLSSKYISMMNRYNVNPSKINLEITETAGINEKYILLENMKDLKNTGITFSLDDFGTGQANLNYICEMPVDIVKFDRDMTSAYFTSKKTKYVMDAAINMIKGMKLKIVAEGIETKEQFNGVVEKGIDYIQGYYFSKPLPEKEFLDFLYKSRNSANSWER